MFTHFPSNIVFHFVSRTRQKTTMIIFCFVIRTILKIISLKFVNKKKLNYESWAPELFSFVVHLLTNAKRWTERSSKTMVSVYCIMAKAVVIILILTILNIWISWQKIDNGSEHWTVNMFAVRQFHFIVKMISKSWTEPQFSHCLLFFSLEFQANMHNIWYLLELNLAFDLNDQNQVTKSTFIKTNRYAWRIME